MGAFELRKWYFDCVTNEGEVFIAYRAELQYRALAIHYASLLRFDPPAGVMTSSSLRVTAQPEEAAEMVTWSAPALRFEGRWRKSGAAPVERTIFSSAQGAVTWRLVDPLADVELELAGKRFTGRGYAEHLTLTVPPWSMPIDELRWGRFTGPTRSLVWVDWRGATSVQVVVADGRVVEGPVSIADDRVGSLEISDARLLRTGALGSTALSILPKRIRAGFPARILLLDERKWRARGTLGGEAGWIVHEVVRWP